MDGIFQTISKTNALTNLKMLSLRKPAIALIYN